VYLDRAREESNCHGHRRPCGRTRRSEDDHSDTLANALPSRISRLAGLLWEDDSRITKVSRPRSKVRAWRHSTVLQTPDVNFRHRGSYIRRLNGRSPWWDPRAADRWAETCSLKALDPKPNPSCSANNVQPIAGMYICIWGGGGVVAEWSSTPSPLGSQHGGRSHEGQQQPCRRLGSIPHPNRRFTFNSKRERDQCRIPSPTLPTTIHDEFPI